MSSNKNFSSLLEELAGEEEIIFVIPYTFLPPRYLSKANERNLLMCIDSDLSASTRWQDTRLQSWNSLTPLAAARLLSEIQTKIISYAKDSAVLASFLKEYGTSSNNSNMPALDDPSSRRADKVPQLKVEVPQLERQADNHRQEKKCQIEL